ncbi:MAG: hypothetical protein JSU88_12455 [Nitrospinaceae bacterium]|nr:MAG: hypothetical protein JSU88_12455 [Nitrospinaceae bacterium]
MENRDTRPAGPAERMKGYLEKVASGPRMSKDLSAQEAEDALLILLNGEASPPRAAAFLIASRMKLETVEENLGFWRALVATTVRHEMPFDRLLQIADPFDGVNRVPYFGFYAIPLLAAMGLPTYGHSARAHAPKFGITFEEILAGSYAATPASGERRLTRLQEHGFGYLNVCHTHPKLESLRALREDIVKRPMLATVEKMLMPVAAQPGGNYLATGYFHKGYEVAMMAIAEAGDFDRVAVGNGMEGTTLYGVHKAAKVFFRQKGAEPREIPLDKEKMFYAKTASQVAGAYQELKTVPARASIIAELGEAALKGKTGPASTLIASQAGTLHHLFGLSPSPQAGFERASAVLASGGCHGNLMRYLEGLR